nr:ribonuclease H-like domain-containing protein [Tanacetum cinerariifolium]
SPKLVKTPRHSGLISPPPMSVAPPVLLRSHSPSKGLRRPKKTYFVCKSETHLIKDCDFHARKLTQNSCATRDVHKHNAPMKYSRIPLHKVPTAARTIGAARPTFSKTHQHITPYTVSKSKAPIRRPFIRNTSHKPSISPARVNAAKPFAVSAARVNAAKPSVVSAARVNAAKPFAVSAARVNAAKPSVVSAARVNAAKPFAASAARVNAANPSTVSAARVHAARLSTVSAARINVVKPSAVTAVQHNHTKKVWRPKTLVLDHVFRTTSVSMTLKQFNYNDALGRSKSELNGGYVAFGGNPKGGKITGKGKIKTGKLDFDDVYYVKELKFNLFSVSQMCDKKNNVLFIDIECLVLSLDFKLPDASQVLLRVPRENN